MRRLPGLTSRWPGVRSRKTRSACSRAWRSDLAPMMPFRRRCAKCFMGEGWRRHVCRQLRNCRQLRKTDQRRVVSRFRCVYGRGHVAVGAHLHHPCLPLPRQHRPTSLHARRRWGRWRHDGVQSRSRDQRPGKRKTVRHSQMRDVQVHAAWVDDMVMVVG